MNSRVAESRDFFPTAIALGSSAIVKVSGQNCFRTLYGFLGQICLGPPEVSAEGSTKVSPRLKVAQVSGSLWSSGADLLGCQKVLSKVPPSLL